MLMQAVKVMRFRLKRSAKETTWLERAFLQCGSPKAFDATRRLRKSMRTVVEHPIFNVFVLGLIFVSLLLMIVEKSIPSALRAASIFDMTSFKGSVHRDS